MAVLSPKAEGSVFNIATGREVSNRELAELVCALSGCRSQVERVERRDIDNISRRCLNIEQIRTQLKWEPQFDIEAGMRKTLQWYRAQQGTTPS